MAPRRSRKRDSHSPAFAGRVQNDDRSHFSPAIQWQKVRTPEPGHRERATIRRVGRYKSKFDCSGLDVRAFEPPKAGRGILHSPAFAGE